MPEAPALLLQLLALDDLLLQLHILSGQLLGRTRQPIQHGVDRHRQPLYFRRTFTADPAIPITILSYPGNRIAEPHHRPDHQTVEQEHHHQ